MANEKAAQRARPGLNESQNNREVWFS